MIRRKQWMAGMLAVIMGMTSVWYPDMAARAGEVTQEYVVVAKNDKGYEKVQDVYQEQVVEEDVASDVLEDNHIAVVELTDTQAQHLEDDKNIVIVDENIMLTGSTFADGQDVATADILTDQQSDEDQVEWNLQAIGAENAVMDMEESKENESGIRIALLDSGVDYVEGVTMAGDINLVKEPDAYSEFYQDETGHGTGIASIIAGNGEGGVYGVNPNAELYSVKVLDEHNQAPLSRIIQGIYWCIDHHMNIINMSFGTNVYSAALEQAVKDADNAGILMIGAAGNNSGAVEYPAAFPEVMAVAATDAESRLCDFSNRGEELDVAAPGEKILVAGFFDGYVVTHGTSIAVPHVTGTASLLWEKDPEKSSQFIRQLIDASVRKIDGTDDCGLLDTEYALQMYDTFAENYDVSAEAEEAEIPVNTELPQEYTQVNEDEAYVEGRWSTRGHIEAFNSVGENTYSAKDIELLKQGCIFPDRKGLAWGDSKGEWGEASPQWHGRHDKADGTLLNYVAVMQMVTDTAIKGGVVSDSAKCSDYPGMDQATFNTLKRQINSLNYTMIFDFCSSQTGYVHGDTKTNRKLFLYGCGIHTITDMFAHSAVQKDGSMLTHDEGCDDVQDTGNNNWVAVRYKERYVIAKKMNKQLVTQLHNGRAATGQQLINALKEGCPDSPLIRYANIKAYVNQNGYNDGVLDKVNKVKNN